MRQLIRAKTILSLRIVLCYYPIFFVLDAGIPFDELSLTAIQPVRNGPTAAPRSVARYLQHTMSMISYVPDVPVPSIIAVTVALALSFPRSVL